MPFKLVKVCIDLHVCVLDASMVYSVFVCHLYRPVDAEKQMHLYFKYHFLQN